MNGYKFLATGGRGPLSGYQWPVPLHGEPGAWVDVEGPLELGVRGVHVCREPDLAHWLHDELFELETRGEQVNGIDCVVVRHARLVRRIDAWMNGGALRFADACIERARSVAAAARGASLKSLLEDAESAARHGYLAVSAYCAALAVARAGNADDTPSRFRDERVWQSHWIVEELIAVRCPASGR
jgi:hypothetical protein